MQLFNVRTVGQNQTSEEHTTEHPYCGDLACWCHTNVEYHDDIQHPERHYTDEQVEQVYAFFGLKR